MIQPALLLPAALMLDLLIGDPGGRFHPTVLLGKVIQMYTAKWNHGSRKRRRLFGIILALGLPALVFAAGWGILLLAGLIHPVAAGAAAIVMTSFTIACRGLMEAVERVAAPLLQGNLPEARKALSLIVGRDTENLNEADTARGAVETAAENISDGITAPLFWALLGGAPLALAYRAVNTLDSMAGYKNEAYEDFGWASARLDDVVNWIPARLTAGCMIFVSLFFRKMHTARGIRTMRRDRKKHPSPNSGLSEALTSGLFGIRLGGVNRYQGMASVRPVLGEEFRPAEAGDIMPASSLILWSAWAFVFFMSVAASAVAVFILS
ncbi:adenosylcobinamide-phosphate synthase CbiB [Alkalicoccus urumqiensis]|uniref:Cobalamin biosynthesis protein CobD n=1 Tax=Alkalicoccus urumqiensis TaxID=1548213 RepID=A0A2P6MI93_ALKUR|nr:adenosylcobinamide-phosphate synthase CbiB [Alkalicoccus urumqiensis]PRO66001.1 cobalamin biosynthesis protein CobD [Alkalicoccus urumqiensis]